VTLGADGITLELNYPVLHTEFHTYASDWGGGTYAQYLSFYTDVVSYIHSKGLKVLIESQATPSSSFAFQTANTGPDCDGGGIDSVIKCYYRQRSFTDYQEERLQVLKTIASVLPLQAGDYLNLSNEPMTEAGKTGFTQLNTFSNYRTMIYQFLSTGVGVETLGLKEIGSPMPAGIKYAAGYGSWEKATESEMTSEVTSLMTTASALDVVDIHLYPPDQLYPNNQPVQSAANYLTRAVALANTINGAGKQMGIHETWLMKFTDRETNGALLDWDGSNAVYSRDPYSFWQPVDQKFLKALVALAHEKGLAYVGPFWTARFFAYIDYADHWDDDVSTRMQAASIAGNTAMNAGIFSPTGYYYSEIIK
jgi:hypothetical protein